MKIKKLLAVLLAILTAICMLTFSACGGEEDTGLILAEENGVYTVSGYEGDSTSVTIPESYEGKKVTKILANAFSGKEIAEITIPSSVNEIGKDAFMGCSKLIKVVYQGSCDEWVEIKFATKDSNPASISKNLVINGEKVTTLTLTTATKVSDFAFSSYLPLTSVDLGDNVVSVGISAFEDCSMISNLTLGDSVESFEYRAFGTCSSLTEVVFTNSVKILYAESFRDCKNLESIFIPASLTTIQKASFNYNVALKSAVFEVTEGWFVTLYENANTGEEVDPEIMADTKEVAELLSIKTYDDDYYWKRVE